MAKTKHILLAAEKLKLSDELSYPALGLIKDTQAAKVKRLIFSTKVAEFFRKTR